MKNGTPAKAGHCPRKINGLSKKYRSESMSPAGNFGPLCNNQNYSLAMLSDLKTSGCGNI